MKCSPTALQPRATCWSQVSESTRSMRQSWRIWPTRPLWRFSDLLRIRCAIEHVSGCVATLSLNLSCPKCFNRKGLFLYPTLTGNFIPIRKKKLISGYSYFTFSHILASKPIDIKIDINKILINRWIKTGLLKLYYEKFSMNYKIKIIIVLPGLLAPLGQQNWTILKFFILLSAESYQ